MNRKNRVKKGFDLLYKMKRSQVYLDICRKIYRDDYPKDAEHDGFVTMNDLRNIVKDLNVGQGDTFIDVGCGRGGPGLWIARETGANYVGLDFSKFAIEEAAQCAKNMGLEDKANFQIGNICAKNFPDNCFDGAISIDTFIYIPDILAALCEVARILRSNALFVFTTWEKKSPSKLNDYRLLLHKASFEIKNYNETPNWERRQADVYQSILDSKDILIKEMGEEGARPFFKEAKYYLPILKYLRRILVTAKKI